mgnify:CR=1 FL=1
MNLRNLAKKLPLDLGQKEYRHKTKGTLIALSLAGKGGGRKAADLGCGEGYWSEKLKEHGWEVSAIDKEKEYSRAITYNLNDGIPLPDSSVNLVFSASVIGYIKDLNFFKKEIVRVLKPGGKYVITTPNSSFWIDYVLKMAGTSLKNLQDSNQKNYFNQKEIKNLFPETKIYGYFPYAVLKFRISHLVGFLSPVLIICGTKK